VTSIQRPSRPTGIVSIAADSVLRKRSLSRIASSARALRDVYSATEDDQVVRTPHHDARFPDPHHALLSCAPPGLETVGSV